MAGLFIRCIGYDRGHDGADKAHSHHDDDFPAFFFMLPGKPLQALEFLSVVAGSGQGKGFSGGGN
jgi:hypothetical protein